MNRYFQTHHKIDVALLIGAVAVAPLVYGGVWLAQDARLPSEAALVIGTVFASGLVWAALAITRVAKVRPARGARISSDLDAPYDLAVVDTAGVCPRGLKVGDRIAVNEAGGPSVSLCRVAIAALNSAGIGSTEISEASANCVCPLEDQRVTFAVAAPAV
jgi:hypothetical protein